MKNLTRIAFSFFLIVATASMAFATSNPLLQYIGKNDSISSQLETKKYIWVGTSCHGLYMIKKKNNKVFHLTKENSQLPSNRITCMAKRDNDEVFIGTDNGIFYYDNYAFLVMTNENSKINSNRITSLVYTKEDTIVVGTLDGGLTLFSSGRTKHYDLQNTNFPSNHIVSLERSEKNECIVTLENNIKYMLSNQQFIPFQK
jgi:ligand-binding sensor domain-containing protein